MTVTVAAVTHATAPVALHAPGTARLPLPLLPVVQAALPAAHGRAALLPPRRPRCDATPARWRMAEAILRDAAAIGGGALFRTVAGGTLLLGASAAAAVRAAAGLGLLAGDAAPLPVWRLPRDTGPLLAWAATESLATQAEPAAPVLSLGPSLTPSVVPPLPLADLHPALDRLPAEAVLRAEALATPDGAALGRRLRLSRRATAAAIWPRIPTCSPMPRTGWRRGCCPASAPGRGTCRGCG
jgi:hypothetical protein